MSPRVTFLFFAGAQVSQSALLDDATGRGQRHSATFADGGDRAMISPITTIHRRGKRRTDYALIFCDLYPPATCLSVEPPIKGTASGLPASSINNLQISS
jgi:hypothetical protein